MTTQALLSDLQNSAIAHLVSKSDHLVGAGLQIVHVIGFVLLLAALLLISLRALGAVLSDQPLDAVLPGLARVFWIGLATAVLSGGLMFVASPQLYAAKQVFLLKIAVLLVAVIAQWGVLRYLRSGSASPALGVRFAVPASLLLWFVVAAAGRAIGFV